MILFILGFLILLVDIFAIKDITSSRLDSLKRTLWILFVLIVPVLGMSFHRCPLKKTRLFFEIVDI